MNCFYAKFLVVSVMISMVFMKNPEKDISVKNSVILREKLVRVENVSIVSFRHSRQLLKCLLSFGNVNFNSGLDGAF